MSNNILFTKEGLIELKNELNHLINTVRPEVIRELKEAREQGDLSENADYDAAKNDQAKLIQADYKPNEKQARYLLPTFTRDMSKCSELQQQQIFSPFFILNTVKYPFDIAKNANLSYYGYAAHLYGGKNKLTKIADDLEVGAVTFNDWSIGLGSAIEGVKQSGFGIQDTRFFGAFYSNVKKLN